jgi:endonuclease/exonuclease/phosphatase family metal-dependent hydrolase
VALRVATFNAGLAPGYLPNVTARLPHIVDALTALAREVDILYLQEVWLDDHYAELRSRLSGALPHVVRQEPSHRPAAGGCAQKDLDPVIDCARKHCAGLRDDALASCVVRNCARLGLSLPPACLNCVASDPRGTMDEIVARCLGAATSASEDILAYGGSFGTCLFSRTPLTHTGALVYPSTLNARGAIHARTSGLHVFATHVSPGSSDQGLQYEALVEWIAVRAPAPAPAIVLGDLNTSAGSSLFRMLTDAGFREPDTVDTRGTWGSGLATGSAGDATWRIDHILTRDVPGYTSSQRILDAPVTLDDGTRTTLSDHCGVLVTIE